MDSGPKPTVPRVPAGEVQTAMPRLLYLRRLRRATGEASPALRVVAADAHGEERDAALRDADE